MPAGPDADHDLVVGDGLEIVALALGLGRDRAAQAGEHDLAVGAGRRQLGGGRVGRQPVDVVGSDRLAHAGQVEQSLHDREGALDLLGGAGHGDRVAPERDPDPEGPLQLLQVGVVHPREQQRIGALGGHTVLGGGVVGHSIGGKGAFTLPPVTSRFNSRRSPASTAVGAPSNSARCAVVLGNAITSRSESTPGEQHHDPIHAEGEPAVGRRAGAEPFQQEAEALLGLRLGNAEQAEHPALQARDRRCGGCRRRARCRSAPCRRPARAPAPGAVSSSGTSSGWGAVNGWLTAPSVPVAGSFSNSGKSTIQTNRFTPVGNQRHPPGDFLPDPVERRAGDVVRARRRRDPVAVGEPEPLPPRRRRGTSRPAPRARRPRP